MVHLRTTTTLVYLPMRSVKPTPMIYMMIYDANTIPRFAVDMLGVVPLNCSSLKVEYVRTRRGAEMNSRKPW
jgi:hypothetical protein